MLKRLRIKFVCINMVIVTIMLGIILGLVLYFTRINMEQQSISMLRSIAMEPMQPGRPDEPPMEVRLPYFILQIERTGEVTAVGGGYYDLSDTDFLQEAANLALASKAQVGVLSDYGLRFYRMVSPNVQRIVFADISYERSTISSLWRACWLIAGVSFFTFLFLVILLSKWAIKPVERAWTQQKQFVADASHELKTPLTVILTNAELLQLPGYTETEKAAFAESVLAESRQMRGLVESLLALARIDHGTAEQALARVDLSKVISRAVLPFEPVFFEKDLLLEVQIAEGIAVQGSEAQLERLAAILLDNAQKYSCAGAATTVVLRPQNRNHCLLVVSNQGEAIPPDELKNIFKRFYRVDKARTESNSYGLGLAIAQSIAELHHGKIWAESKNGVNTFFVSLPTCL